MNLALNNLQKLICYKKNQPTKSAGAVEYTTNLSLFSRLVCFSVCDYVDIPVIIEMRTFPF